MSDNTTSRAAAFSQQGWDYIASQDYSLAIDAFSAAIRIESENADHYLNRGLAHCLYGDKGQLGEYELALSDMVKAVELNPEDALAWYNLGHIQMAFDNYAKALDAFKTAREFQTDKEDVGERIAECEALLAEQETREEKVIIRNPLFGDTVTTRKGLFAIMGARIAICILLVIIAIIGSCLMNRAQEKHYRSEETEMSTPAVELKTK